MEKSEEKETIDTYQYQEEMHMLTEPNPRTNDLNEDEVDKLLEYYRQMEEETDKEMEQIRKVNQSQQTQVGHPEPKAHTAPHSIG